ncbi:glycosyltransferase [Simiduia litorea]|uniref:glycosyltransferase family 2 protein n=1 Tax=Simiduia litorea TaxID=1435348 RepID=UPI0036F2F7AD
MSVIKEQPLVSIVIATYNMAQYLPQAVDSILNQEWKNIELIVVDDGSADNTADVMEKYAQDPRVNYIKNTNQGQPKAKNCGIKHTKGEFIAFCDADDLWEPNKLTVQMPLFKSPRVGVVFSDVSNIDENNKRYSVDRTEIGFRGNVTEQLLHRNFVPFGTAVIRRQCIVQNGIFDEEFRMGIDWDLWLRYSLNWEFDYVNDRTYVYRKWSGQMSSNYRGRYDHAFRILQKFERRFRSQVEPKILKLAWADMYVSQANAIARNEKLFKEPLLGVIKGLSIAPTYVAGWRLLAKLFLRRD